MTTVTLDDPLRPAVNAGDEVLLVGSCVGTHLELRSKAVFAQDGLPVRSLCPICRRDIEIKIEHPKDMPARRPMRSAPVLCDREYAFVGLLYGDHPAYFVGALVTGWTLQKHSSLPLRDRILLCTSDVPERYIALLSTVWTVRAVEYITKAPPKCYWDYNNSRFKEVFTKLRVFSTFAGEYKKIILLDLDLLVRGEVDSLFSLNAPAAMVRGQSFLRHGEKVPIDLFYNGHRQVLGINCGVMMIEPSAAVFKHMESEIADYGHPEHWPSHGPEQDYLSRYFNAFGAWTNISCRYNYQVHLTQFGSAEWHHLNTRGHKKVSIYHYSGRLVRPWDILLDLLIVHGMSYDDITHYVGNTLIKKAQEAHALKLRNESHPALKLSCAQEAKTSRFCQYKKCYLHKYIHPSWTEADTDSVIEWIGAFKELDDSLNHQLTGFLRDLLAEELAHNANENSSTTFTNVDESDSN